MNTKIRIGMSLLTILALIALVSPGQAGASSPFNGHWLAIDVDGSDIRLTFGGPPDGPFNITWTESYISFCGGEAGIIRGRGWLEDDITLTADLHLECFTTGDTLDFQVTWIYDSGTDTITSDFTTWQRASARSIACVPPPSGLIAWWPGDGDAGELIAGRDGILQGDATTGSGLVNMAFWLDGDGDYVEVPHDPALNVGTGDFTVDLWVNFRDLSGEQVLAEKFIQGDGTIYGWTLTKLDNQVLRLALDSGGGNEADLDAGELNLQPGIWYHFAATRRGAEVTLFMNGAPIAQNSEIGPSNLNTAAPFLLGRRGDERGFYLNGRIDEVELFVGTALSADQILAIYQAGSAGKCKDAVQPPPRLDLRVNYGDDWVESFYEAGHTVWVTVTEGDGVTVKATAAVVTEPKDFWGGETGFQTSPEDWVPAPPDIQPNDWVYGWVDNGASAAVQIGDISGMIDLIGDSIEGTIYAPWFSGEEEVFVECHPWGSPEPVEMKFDAALPDGADPYTCSWAGEWDIQPGQVVGVGYFGPDGHWVANAFSTPSPRILASITHNWFQAEHFNPWAWLTLSIFESPGSGEPLWSETRQADETGFVFVGQWEHPVDLVPGSYLVVSDGFAEKQLALEEVWLDVFDPDENYLAGRAPAGRFVWVGTGNEFYGCSTELYADEAGNWSYDFDEQGCDVTADMWAAAQVFDDDGDATEANPPPPPPNPVFGAFPEWEAVEGWNWPEGAMVHLEIDDPDTAQAPDYQQDGPVVPTPWDPNQLWVQFLFGEWYNMQPGNVVTLNDGTTIRTHVVRNLAVSGVDIAEDIVFGTADAGAEVYVWPHATGETLLAIADPLGAWQVDFSESDLALGDNIRAEIRDEEGNATTVDWRIPNPHFTIFPEWEWYDGWEWPDGIPVAISVEGKPECATGGTSSGGFFNGGFPGGCDVGTDDTVIFTDDVTTRTHVVRNLAVTAVDHEANTVSGTADPGAEIHIWPHATGQELLATADSDGNWQVDFTGIFDLVPGEAGRSEIRDGAGNATAVDWQVPPPPRILVQITDNWFEAQNFASNAALTFKLYETLGGTEVLSGTLQADDQGTVGIWVGDQTDLVVGNHLVVTDGITTKSLTLEAITFDLFDTNLGLLQGTAPPPDGRLVWVGIGWADYGWGTEVTTGQGGNWSASYGGPVPPDYQWVAAQVFDEDGDASEVRPAIVINGQP